LAPPSPRELAEELARRGRVDLVASSLDEAPLKARLAEEEVLAEAKGVAEEILSSLARAAGEARGAEAELAYEVAVLALKLAAGEQPRVRLPGDVERIAEGLARAIAEAPALIKGDLAGRIYNEALRDLAKRKGLAAYYTEAPAAHLLARLAASALAGRGLVKVADFACGTGALLAAAYIALSRSALRVELYGVEADPPRRRYSGGQPKAPRGRRQDIQNPAGRRGGRAKARRLGAFAGAAARAPRGARPDNYESALHQGNGPGEEA
jgi:hypothetical protein